MIRKRRKKIKVNIKTIKRQQKYYEYNERLKYITKRLNALYDEATPLREEYYKIMAYFRTQKNRGLITEEEYQEKVAMFKYLGKHTSHGK